MQGLDCYRHHRAALDAATRWGLTWRRFADKAADHLASLDHRTDKVPILRWWCRWRSALRRAELAELRARYHDRAARLALRELADCTAVGASWAPGDIDRLLRRAGVR